LQNHFSFDQDGYFEYNLMFFIRSFLSFFFRRIRRMQNFLSFSFSKEGRKTNVEKDLKVF